MKALILAAGYGTRLYPLITNTPKPLLTVADKPLINHIMDKIRPLSGLDEVLVVTNDKFHKNFEEWAQKIQPSFPVPVKIINDGTTTPENRLGSIGDIDFVIKKCKIDNDLLVLGGDNLFDYSLEAYLVFARAKTPAVTIGLYDIKDLKAATIYGVAQIAQDGKLTSFEEKPAQPRSTLIAMCFYHCPRASLSCLEQYIRQTQKMDKAGDYIHWLCEEKGVYGFKFSGKWYDIGSMESYREAQEKFSK